VYIEHLQKSGGAGNVQLAAVPPQSLVKYRRCSKRKEGERKKGAVCVYRHSCTKREKQRRMLICNSDPKKEEKSRYETQEEENYCTMSRKLVLKKVFNT
jgi:hypothetical protein